MGIWRDENLLEAQNLIATPSNNPLSYRRCLLSTLSFSRSLNHRRSQVQPTTTTTSEAAGKEQVHTCCFVCSAVLGNITKQ